MTYTELVHDDSKVFHIETPCTHAITCLVNIDVASYYNTTNSKQLSS